MLDHYLITAWILDLKNYNYGVLLTILSKIWRNLAEYVFSDLLITVCKQQNC